MEHKEIKPTPDRNPAQAELTTTEIAAPSSTTNQVLVNNTLGLFLILYALYCQTLPEIELFMGNSGPKGDHDRTNQDSVELGQTIGYLGADRNTWTSFFCVLFEKKMPSEIAPHKN